MNSAVGVLAAAVREQRCILFLGAGVHTPPPIGSPYRYPATLQPPTGGALSRQLAAACALSTEFPDEDPGNLARVALAYEVRGSRRQLVNAIAKAVDAGTTPSPMLTAIAQLDFPIVVTTNYDQLFDRALRDAAKNPRISIYTPEREVTTEFDNESAASPVIYKLHGDIAHHHSLVVTDEDYIQFVLRMTDKDPYDPIPLSLKHYFKRWTTLFIGYSLKDYNLRLLFKTLRWRIDPARIPDTFSVDPYPDPLILDIWQNQQRYVTFIAQDIWSFVPDLYQAVIGKALAP